MKPHHLPPKSKTVQHTSEVRPRRHHESSPPKTSKTANRDGQDFKALLKDDPEPVVEPLGDLLFYFNSPEPERLDEPHQADQTFNSLAPDLIEQTENAETLPAEFSLLLPETGEVGARLSEGLNGETRISLGFNEDVLARMVGFEKRGEALLSKRLGRSVRLHFKRIDAL